MAQFSQPTTTERPDIRPNNEILLGPIPWDWILAAYAAGPSCLPVALALWHGRMLAHSPTYRLPMKRLAKFVGLSHRTVQRRIADLEEAGLIKVEEQSGKRHVYTVIENPGGTDRRIGG